MSIRIRPWGSTNPDDELDVTETGLPQDTSALVAGGYEVGRIAWEGVQRTIPVPALSSPTDEADGSTAATGGVTTTIGDGTLYWVVSTSGTAPSAAQVKAGQDHTGAAAADSGSQAVSATGAQTLSPAPSGLTASTAYTIHFMHEDSATNQSTVASGDGFTTAATATAPAQMAAPTVTASSDTEISVDRAAAPSDGGSAILSYDLRYEVDGSGSWTTVTGITDPQSVTGLTASTLYNVQTRAVNAVDAGAWSASGSATTDAASGAMFTDTFSYTGNLEDQAGWTPVAGAGNSGTKPAANGSTASIPPGANAGWLLECQTALSADQYSEITIGDAGDGSGNVFWLIVRMTDGDNYYYAGIQNHNLKTLYKRVAGVQTQIGTTQTNQLVNGDVVRMEVEGTTLRLIVNGSPVYTETDSALSGGSAGLRFERIDATVTTTATLDSYSAGDL